MYINTLATTKYTTRMLTVDYLGIFSESLFIITIFITAHDN